MTTRPQLLAPVISSSRTSAARRQAMTATVRPLSLARSEAAPQPPGDVAYGIGPIDASGRISDRGVIRALGWQGGDLLLAGLDQDPQEQDGPLQDSARVVQSAALRRSLHVRNSA